MALDSRARSTGTTNVANSDRGVRSTLESEQLALDLAAVDLEMTRNFPQNGRECTDPEGLVIRDGEMMFPVVLSGQPKMAAALTRSLISIGPERLGKFAAPEIPRQLHAAITSSWTKCRRSSFGVSAGSK